MASARGFASTPKSLPPAWFYDELGCDLFDEITRLPEYYPTRAERSILAARSDAIADAAGCDTLVELGSGTSEKTRLLLDAMTARGLERFVAFDISEPTLRAASATGDSAATPGEDEFMEFWRSLPEAARGDMVETLVTVFQNPTFDVRAAL